MERESGLSILGSSGWLAGTPPEFRKRFLSAARWCHVDPGTTLTLGGEEKDNVIGLAHGTVALTSTLGRAGNPVMHMAHAVLWIGYGPLLLERPRDVTAEARTDLWIAVIPKAKILPLLDESTLWWRCFMRLLAEYGDTSAMVASDLLIRQSDRRLAATILRFAGLRGLSSGLMEPVRLPITQAELAEAANLSRNATGTILRKLAAKGYLEIDYRGVVVHDPAGLQKFVAEVPV
ncbi:Crp/Fnr family transcriptional regulator [Aestuariivirga sp.]|uniref:Crp/Fnr family transcriptional regulator n=1 Tax=Aestuariivirga sp. TaxID=2650926 RepID=UPI0035937239